MIRVVLDTNIIISAALSKNPTPDKMVSFINNAIEIGAQVYWMA
jgi:predicted nucleic acid-binding protein